MVSATLVGLICDIVTMAFIFVPLSDGAFPGPLIAIIVLSFYLRMPAWMFGIWVIYDLARFYGAGGEEWWLEFLHDDNPRNDDGALMMAWFGVPLGVHGAVHLQLVMWNQVSWRQILGCLW